MLRYLQLLFHKNLSNINVNLQFLLLATVANTSSDGPRNALRKTYKSTDLLVNPRHRIIQSASSPRIDGKGKIGGQTRADCIQDYAPCSCYMDSDNQIVVDCQGVSIQNARDMFLRVNDTEIYSLSWSDPMADARYTYGLPADFLGNTSVTGYIYIECDLNSNYVSAKKKLVIDPLAFRLSQNSLTIFAVSSCNFVYQKDFNFLKGFNKLEELWIAVIDLTAFQYLPPLPSLQKLSIAGCPDVNEIAFPDLSPSKLKHLFLYDNEISDEKADEIVAKLAASTSADSLEGLYLDENYLTRIPSRIGSSFLKLKNIYLSWNNISHIPPSSLTFVSPYLENLALFEIGIQTIESGAFQGKPISTPTICFSLQQT